jgi:hypothetical protein
MRQLLDAKVNDLYKVLSVQAESLDRNQLGVAEVARKVNAGSCMEIGEVVRDLLRWKSRFVLRRVRCCRPAAISRARSRSSPACRRRRIHKIRRQVGVAA